MGQEEAFIRNPLGEKKNLRHERLQEAHVLGLVMRRSVGLTQRRLQHISVLFTGADRLDVGRVHQPPEVVAVVAAVQAETETDPG